MAKLKTDSIAFSLYVAKFYIQKRRLAERCGHKFSLSLVDFCDLFNKKRCYYTGVELTFPDINESGNLIPGVSARDTDISLDRVDNKKGYEKGNVVSCTRAANNVKSMFESGSYALSLDQMVAMGNKLSQTKSPSTSS